jgi:hypothetical protein
MGILDEDGYSKYEIGHSRETEKCDVAVHRSLG